MPAGATRRPGLRCRSVARQQDEQRYRAAKDAHFREHPACQFPGCVRSLRRGHVIDLHHKAGRSGPLLFHRPFFASLCRQHHDHVHAHPGWAREAGWLIDLPHDEVFRIRQAEILSRT